MDELLKTVAERTGLPPDKAKGAVEAVLDFLKDKLPEPIASQIDGFIDGEGADDIGDLLDKGKGMLGGLLGGDK
jgi:hypothetical protein